MRLFRIEFVIIVYAKTGTRLRQTPVIVLIGRVTEFAEVIKSCEGKVFFRKLDGHVEKSCHIVSKDIKISTILTAVLL